MNQQKAERALAAVKKKYQKYLSFDNNADHGPTLMQDWGLGSTCAPWAVVWEVGAPDGWALLWGSTRREDPAGIVTEVLASFALAVYDGD